MYCYKNVLNKEKKVKTVKYYTKCVKYNGCYFNKNDLHSKHFLSDF